MFVRLIKRSKRIGLIKSPTSNVKVIAVTKNSINQFMCSFLYLFYYVSSVYVCRHNLSQTYGDIKSGGFQSTSLSPKKCLMREKILEFALFSPFAILLVSTSFLFFCSFLFNFQNIILNVFHYYFSPPTSIKIKSSVHFEITI